MPTVPRWLIIYLPGEGPDRKLASAPPKNCAAGITRIGGGDVLGTRTRYPSDSFLAVLARVDRLSVFDASIRARFSATFKSDLCGAEWRRLSPGQWDFFWTLYQRRYHVVRWRSLFPHGCESLPRENLRRLRKVLCGRRWIEMELLAGIFLILLGRQPRRRRPMTVTILHIHVPPPPRPYEPPPPAYPPPDILDELRCVQREHKQKWKVT